MRNQIRRALLMIALAGPVGAQDTASNPRAVQPERPTVATHAFTVAPGYVEVEAGAQGDRIGSGSRAYEAPIVTKIGLGRRVQLNVTTPFGFAAPGRSGGLGDVSAGVKWRLTNDAPLVGSFAVLPSVKFATGSASRGTGSGTTDVSLTAISSRRLGAVAVDLNATYTRTGSEHESPATDQALWTASFGFPVRGKWSGVAEAFGEPTIDGSSRRSSVALLVGPTFLVSPALNLDVGAITPLRGDISNAIYAGAVWNLGRLPLPGRRAGAR